MKRCFLLAALVTVLVASVAAQDPERIKLGVIPGALRYDVSRFDIRAGTSVEIEFTNNGLMPHNLLFVNPGQTDAVTQAAMALGASGMAVHYLPHSKNVLAATKIVQPGKSEVIRLPASKPGIYGYVCTFPGHGTIMRGVLRVRASGVKLESPVRVLPGALQPKEGRLASTDVTPLPRGTRNGPYVIRTFMPNPGLDAAVLSRHTPAHRAKSYDVNSGRDKDSVVATIDGLPAAIGVSFGPSLSYCWDTVECRMLYAWTGGFLDMSAYWGAKAGGGRKSYDYVPRLRGSLIHSTSGPHPLAAHGVPRYIGYALVDGVPEFAYRIGSWTVKERITPHDTALNLVCKYEITGGSDALQMTFEPSILERMKITPGRSGVGRHQFTAKIRGEVQVAKKVERAKVVHAAHRLRGGRAPEQIGDIVALIDGVIIFRDRDYSFRTVPRELRGADYIATYNDDKAGEASVSWTVEFGASASVFLLMDARIEDLPAWMSGGTQEWKRTSLQVKTSGNWFYRVYQTDVDKGAKITLGSQAGGSFYGIAATRRKS